MPSIFTIVIIITVAIAVVILLTWKNYKDKKLMNPDAPDSVEEAKADQERRRDKV
jgi:hypothetical protein